MPNKFNNLTKEFELLKKKLEQCPPVSQISSKELLNYHSLISKKELLESQISQLLNSKNNILKKYSTRNEKLLYDDNLSCRKYCKLEQKASYSRDKKLYKLGFLDLKPTPPILQNLKQFVTTKIMQPASDYFSPKLSLFKRKFLSHINKSPLPKVNNFIKNTLPLKLTNTAINGTKKCILGYRTISNSLTFSAKTFSRNVSSAPVIQFLSYINTQAKKEADLQSNSFRSRIKVDISNSPVYSSNHKIQEDYDLAL